MGLLEDKQAQLVQINTAISAILTGAQEYSIGSRRLRRADLRILYDERRKLENEIASIQGQNISVAYFDRR